jgi:hypothetical protein
MSNPQRPLVSSALLGIIWNKNKYLLKAENSSSLKKIKRDFMTLLVPGNLIFLSKSCFIEEGP